MNKVKTFNKGKDLTFDEITASWLKNYEAHHKSKFGNSNNTVHSELKVIRRVINEAIREDIVAPEKNPFHKYKPKWEATTKEFLKEEELAALENLMLVENSSKWNLRNMYVLVAYKQSHVAD